MAKRKSGHRKDDGPKDGESERKEAVKETISAWRGVARASRKLLRPRVLLTMLAVVIIIFLIYCGYVIHATITQNLLIIVEPSGLVREGVNSETIPIEFSLRTNNYLFCESACELSLADIGTGETIASEEIILRNANHTFSTSVSLPEKGEGKQFYSFTASCKNIERTTCSRSLERVLTSALVVVEYGPGPAEAAARATMIEETETLITNLSSMEARLAMAESLVENLLIDAKGDGLDGLVEELSRARRAVLRMENIEHGLRAAILAYENAEVPFQEVMSLSQELDGLIRGAQEYYGLQHELVRKLEQDAEAHATAPWLALAATHEPEKLSSYETALDTLLREVSAEPAASVLSRMTRLILLEEEHGKLEKIVNAQAPDDLAAIESALARELLKKNQTMKKAPANLEVLDAILYRCDQLAATNSTNSSLCDEITAPRTYDPETALRKLEMPVVDVDILPRAKLELPEPVCCHDGACKPCCVSCAGSPVLFLHGHSMNGRNSPRYSLGAFAPLVEELQARGVVIDAGFITPYSRTEPFPKGAWGGNDRIAVSGTYYYDTYLHGSSYVLSTEKSENIDTYAIRLQDLIDTLRDRTGAEKVVVVTHSMGGLVARRYLQVFGTDKVERLIMVGPPNHGTEAKVAKICPLLGADRECQDLKAGSLFLLKLNDPSRQPELPMRIIYGAGCPTADEDGDGVVTIASALLDGVPATAVEGSCTSFTALHTEMLLPEKYPEVVGLLVQELESS